MQQPRSRLRHFGFEMFGITIVTTAQAEWENTMTQSQIVQTVADKIEVTKKVAKATMDKLSETAIAQVRNNGVFVIPGIGRLVRVERKARMGRNPATGEAIKIPAKKAVKLRVAKAAKDAIVPKKK